MKVTFFGTRGSIPTPIDNRQIKTKIRNALIKASDHDLSSDDAVESFIEGQLDFHERSTFGGDTACVHIEPEPNVHIVCDAGSGLRRFGNAMLGRYGPTAPQEYHLVMSHLHWDHVMGFPFFAPAYIPDNVVHIHSCHEVVEAAFRDQNSLPGFPIPFDVLGSNIHFHVHEPGTPFQIAGFEIGSIKQYHGGDSFGYAFNGYGKKIIYSTDSEHKTEDISEDYPFVDFFKDADLLIFDAQYSLAEAVSLKEDWGHSSNIIGVELAKMAGVKTLCLFHHEPNFTDDKLATILQNTIRFEELCEEGASHHELSVISAYDGLVLENL